MQRDLGLTLRRVGQRDRHQAGADKRLLVAWLDDQVRHATLRGLDHDVAQHTQHSV